MNYFYDLGAGQRIDIENQGNQTIINNSISRPGQQQQSSSSFSTGAWTSPPEFTATPNGILIKLKTLEGEKRILIQGGNVAMEGTTNLQPLPPLQPMQMKMGNMQMNMNSPAQQQPTKHFCSQCGTKMGLGDRFCSSCGKPL